MEVHLVHEHPLTGERAVVGLWLEVPRAVVQAVRDLRGQYASLDQLSDANTQGEVRRLLHDGHNPFLDALEWNKLPTVENESRHLMSGKLLNVFDVLPFDQGYLTYAGSLTTPPCTENVRWFVLKSPVSCSIAQRNTFLSLFGTNARPTQLLHGRNVTMTLDSDRPTRLTPTGVSHDLFMLTLGALIVCALLLMFAVLFLCTRSQHRLARSAVDSRSRLLALLSPAQRQSLAAGGGGNGGVGGGHNYQSIDLLEEGLLDDTNAARRFRASASGSGASSSSSVSGAAAMHAQQPLHVGGPPAGGQDNANPPAGGAAGGHYGSLQ
jgi:hypothetical protein